MNHCPKCKAEPNIPGINAGPTILKLEHRQYRAMCLNCWHKAEPATTEKGALKNWKDQITKNQWRAKRNKLGLSVKELSQLSEVHVDQIYRYENGRATPSKDVAKRLNACLNAM